MTKKDGKTAELLIGRRHADRLRRLRQAAGRSAGVHDRDYRRRPSLDKKPDDLRDKRLLTFDPDKLTRVELQAKGADRGVRQEQRRTSGRS